MKYDNPFIYKRPLYPGRDELIMIERWALLEKTITGLEFGHWFALSCGKKTGKTSFLLRLIDECNKRHPDYHFIMINLEELPKFSQVKLNKLILQKVSELLSQNLAPSPFSVSTSLGVQEFKSLLTGLACRFGESSKIIFILDNFETAPRAFAKATLQNLINLHQPPSTCTPLAEFQFIVAGSLTLNDLLLKQDRSFSEYAMKVFLDDFRLEDVEDMLSRVGTQLNIPCQSGFARLLYDATGGMGYLVQKICYRILETAFMKNEKPELTLKNGDEAIGSIIREGETNVEMIIRQIEKDNHLVESLMRALRAGAIKSFKFDHHLKCLVSLGALTERNGAYRIRNHIYKTIFQDYFTAERLADLYLSQKKYHRARELFLEALTKQSDAKNALEKLLPKSKALGTSLNQKNAARNIVQIFMKTVDGAQNCSLMMPDGDHRSLKIIEAIGLDPKDITSFELKNGEGIAGWVAQTGRTRVIRNVTDEIECPEFVDREFAIKLNIGAMISLPVQIGDHLIGVINLCLSKPHEFNSSEVKMLEILADQAAIVLQKNKTLYHSIERYQNYLDILQDITRDFVSYLDEETIFEKIFAAVSKITGSDKTYLIYKMAANGSWEFRFAEPYSRNGKKKLPNLINREGIAGYVLVTGKPYFAAEVRHDEHYFQIWDDVRSELAVPLLIDNEVNGCLVITSQVQAAFSEVQQKLINMLANLAGLAIKNHRLYGIAEKNTQQVITSKGIGDAISHEKGLQEILSLIVNECLNSVGYPNKSAMVLLNDKERGLVVQAEQGEALVQNVVGKPALEKSLATWVFRQGKPDIATNVQNQWKYQRFHLSMRSEIGVPLIFHEEVIGVITVQSTMPDDFDRLDQDSLMAVAHDAAIAIANARLREDLKKMQIDLTKALEAAAIEEAVAGLTHDIKNISAMIAGETQWLEKLDQEDRLDFSEVKRSIGEINAYVRKIEDFASNLRQRAYKLRPQLNWFTLKVVVDEAVRLIATKAERLAVKIKKDDTALDVQLYGDSGLLVRAFFNIMTNAIDAMPNGGVLQITAQNDGERIGIDFSDTGMGISELDLGRVLDPLFTTKKKGYGLGLAITKRIVEADHHGKLTLKSKQGKGTTVVVWLPLNHVIPPVEVNPHTNSILVVNDDALILNKIKQLLEADGHRVRGTAFGKEAVEFCKRERFEVIVLDYHLKKDHSSTQTAADFLPEIKKNAPVTPIILASASIDHLKVPKMEYDIFLEINHTFWHKITDHINQFLRKPQGPLELAAE